MKTIYITEKQEKKLKKAIAAQDQVGGKVNAGIMDAVVGGMCENVEDDEYELGAEKNQLSPFYHIGEGKLNESPDSLESVFDNHWGDSDAIPFLYLNETGKLYFGSESSTHYEVIENIINSEDSELPDDYKYYFKNEFSNAPYDEFMDSEKSGRYWGSVNVISFWRTPINQRTKISRVIDFLESNGVIQDRKYTLLEYWDNKSTSSCIFPVKWLFNGTYDMFAGRYTRIAPIKSNEYIESGKYTWFQVFVVGKGVQCVNFNGDEILTGMEYQMKNYGVNESIETNDTITLYHGVNRKGLEFNLENGGFIPRVCSEGGPKAVWLSEKQYNYEFSFAFDIPRHLVEQLSNVDYVYRNKIGFEEFNCRLVETSLNIYLDNSTVVEVNILNDKLSKLHFRYFPDLGIMLWKEYKDFPNILETYINPYIEKYQTIEEDIDKENRMIDIKRVVNSNSFKQWFGNSKVVDEHGFPLIVHHGSPKFIGDKFDKNKIGKSLNGGESGVFCTTQDMSWAKRFSYPISPGSYSFTVKVDYSKPGDILSGFLKLEHPLDFFNLSDSDWRNIVDIIKNSYASSLINDEKINDLKYAISVGNHQLLKHDISAYNDIDFGNVLKKYGYDGYIALMDKKSKAIEYCFIEPNQFKSIYSLSFNPNNDSIYEGKKKTVKNDKGEVVPDKCDKCGGDVVLQIHGEPVYVCKDCGKYFGTMPFNLKENVETETKWNGEGDEFNLIKVKQVPKFLYHASPKVNREDILKDGLLAWVGNEYKDWWNYEGPNGEIPDNEELPELVFLSYQPNTWSDCYYLDQMDVYKIDTSKLNKNLFYTDPDRHLRLKGCFCYGDNIPASAIELIGTTYRGKMLKENVETEILPKDVDLTSFNIKKKLNPDFWEDGHLDSRIRLKLLDISDDFIEYLGINPDIVKDVIMTGSLANFNWNEKFSDIDLHVLVDYSDVDENTEFVKQYFLSQKNAWNSEHNGITIFGFPVEVYVQDVNEKHDSSGVYSLDRDKWLIEPDREVLAKSKVNKEFIREKVSDYVNKIDKLIYLYNKAKDDEYKLGKVAENAQKLWDEIKTNRKKGFELSKGKEINNFNIIFKSLRRNDYLDKLYQLKTKTYNKLNSLA